MNLRFYKLTKLHPILALIVIASKLSYLKVSNLIGTFKQKFMRFFPIKLTNSDCVIFKQNDNFWILFISLKKRRKCCL